MRQNIPEDLYLDSVLSAPFLATDANGLVYSGTDLDLGVYDLTATDVNDAKVYLGDNGTVGDYNSWFQERPSDTTRRIMTYGLAQSGSFGTVISPTDTTGQDVYCNIWDRDFDNVAVTDGYYGGFQREVNSKIANLSQTIKEHKDVLSEDEQK